MVLTRSLLALAGLSALTLPLGAPIGQPRSTWTAGAVTTTSTVVGAGYYLSFPFDVPDGIDRVEVAVAVAGPAVVGLGLFDQRGPGYQSAGFRGVYGQERDRCWITADDASDGFLPGPVLPGTWTAVVPVFGALVPSQVTVTVTLRDAAGGATLPAIATREPRGEWPGARRARGAGRRPDEGRAADTGAWPAAKGTGPGWYRGDLHCHTVASSDAWATGRALTASDWGDECRRVGLDFASLTDHNVVAQNHRLDRAAGPGVLLLGGQEMTNWFHGHATVSGLPPEAWLDWRQRPRGLAARPDEGRIHHFLAAAREFGAYVAAAHPLLPLASWHFLREAETDPRAMPDGIEVWNGPFQLDDQAALAIWDGLLRRGHRVSATGGSDVHARDAAGGTGAGRPTTVVRAEALSTQAIVAALRAGRAFVTRHPRGAEVEVSAEHRDGRHAGMGTTLRGRPGDLVRVRAAVRRAAGMRLVLVAGGRVVSTVRLRTDDEVVTAEVPIHARYVRAEVRGRPWFDVRRPFASRLDMEALSNPVYLTVT